MLSFILTLIINCPNNQLKYTLIFSIITYITYVLFLFKIMFTCVQFCINTCTFIHMILDSSKIFDTVWVGYVNYLWITIVIALCILIEWSHVSIWDIFPFLEYSLIFFNYILIYIYTYTHKHTQMNIYTEHKYEYTHICVCLWTCIFSLIYYTDLNLTCNIE